MKKQKQSKTVLLPLADGKIKRFVKSHITLIGTTYEVNSSTPKTVLCTGAGHRFVINLNEYEVRKRVGVLIHEKS